MNSQPTQNTESQHYQEDEINLKQLLRSLADRKWFIFGFTGLITVLAIAYALSIAPTYKATTSFLSPNESSVIQLNRNKLTSETSETIYRKFLNKVMSSQFQRKVFDENDYLSKLNPDNKPIKNLNSFVNGFTKSIILESSKDKKNEKVNYEKPVNVSIEGNNASIIASFLNDLTNSANTQTVNEFLTIIQQKIDIRVDGISKQKALLLSKAKQDRFSKIAQIQEQDLQKTNEINDQIGRLRIKAKKDKLNKIQILTDSAMIAKSLGITENNFKKIGNDSESVSTLTVAIGDNQKLPQWYLYGEKAILQEIGILKNRENDDAYTPEIVNLQNELSAIKSNQELKTLKSRKDDSPFIAEINKLDIEAIKLKSFALNPVGINTMEINKRAYPPVASIKSKKKLIVAVAFIAGFILSILLVLIMNAFRSEEK